MAKKFCTTGTCIPEKNYMVDLSNRIQQIINQYIESGQYFTINRARQYGKTTLLYLLEKELRKQDYLVLSLSFEAADEYFESLGSLAEGLSLDIEECLREQNVDLIRTRRGERLRACRKARKNAYFTARKRAIPPDCAEL